MTVENVTADKSSDLCCRGPRKNKHLNICPARVCVFVCKRLSNQLRHDGFHVGSYSPNLLCFFVAGRREHFIVVWPPRRFCYKVFAVGLDILLRNALLYVKGFMHHFPLDDGQTEDDDDGTTWEWIPLCWGCPFFKCLICSTHKTKIEDVFKTNFAYT